MGFAVKNHRLDGVKYAPSKWIGKAIKPEIVVLHDTASRLSVDSAANYLRTNDQKVSAHLVVERDCDAPVGEFVSQLVPFNRRANHAGKSSFAGKENCNNFSIGIEIVNPGIMQAGKSGFARAWYGQEFDIEAYGIQQITTPEHGSGYWMPYTEQQIDCVVRILEGLFSKYNSLRDVTTHYYISPGRKVDTNPLFPIKQIRSRILGREEPAVVFDMGISSDEPDNFSEVNVAEGATLNMRKWPSINPNVICSVPNKVVVPVLRTGVIAGRVWSQIIFDGQEGWVVDQYLKQVGF